jgi:hypothetical protein
MEAQTHKGLIIEKIQLLKDGTFVRWNLCKMEPWKDLAF